MGLRKYECECECECEYDALGSKLRMSYVRDQVNKNNEGKFLYNVQRDLEREIPNYHRTKKKKKKKKVSSQDQRANGNTPHDVHVPFLDILYGAKDRKT